MNAYTVHLDAFEGPLDLLLHLIEKNKIDIYDIPISSLTEQYIDYIEQSEGFDIELSIDFLLMASTLLVIKSKMLLPKKEDAEEVEEDPRKELVNQILEYRRFKALMPSFKALKEEGETIHVRMPSPLKIKKLPPKNIPLHVLVDAFRFALSVEKELSVPEVLVAIEEYSIHRQITFIVERLMDSKGKIFFTSLSLNDKKPELIINFLALLELIKRKVVDVRQEAAFFDIQISIKKEKTAKGE